MSEGLRPIQLLPAREYVASALRDAILSRKFEPNMTLTLDAVSKMLNVSKTPVREAFQTLERDGLIKLVPNKGAMVLGVTAKKIIDCYELRSVLECAAAERICRYQLPLGEIGDTVGELEKIVASGNYQGYPNNNLRFHQALWNACENDRLKDVVQQLCSGLNLDKGYTSANTRDVETVLSQHGAIWQALKRYDGAAASEAARRHVERSMNRVLTSYGAEGNIRIEI